MPQEALKTFGRVLTLHWLCGVCLPGKAEAGRFLRSGVRGGVLRLLAAGKWRCWEILQSVAGVLSVTQVKTVLYIVDALNVGGAQELLVQLARHTAPQFRTVVCSLQDDQAMAARLAAAGAEVVVLGLTRPSILRPGQFLVSVVGAIRGILRLCARVQPDIIHCHLADATLLGVAASLFLPGAKVFITKHTPVLAPGRSWLDFRQPLRRAVLWLVYRRARAIIAVSQETREALLDCYRLPPDRVVTIANGVPIPAPDQTRAAACRAAFGLAPQDVLVLNVGRLVPVKGQIHLVTAMAGLSGAPRRFVLLLAGEGPCREELARSIAAQGLGERVRLLGDRDDVPQLYAAADIVAFASLSEGTSLAVIEAMAAAKPIVATAVGGNCELLENGISALLVPPADPAALAEALAVLARDAPLANRLGQAARAKAVAGYSIERVVESYAAVWAR
nr:glycosyltransferase [Solidesulfovibrio aerotolerans]